MTFEQAKQVMLDSPDTTRFYTCDDELDDLARLCRSSQLFSCEVDMQIRHDDESAIAERFMEQNRDKYHLDVFSITFGQPLKNGHDTWYLPLYVEYLA